MAKFKVGDIVATIDGSRWLIAYCSKFEKFYRMIFLCGIEVSPSSVGKATDFSIDSVDRLCELVKEDVTWLEH